MIVSDFSYAASYVFLKYIYATLQKSHTKINGCAIALISERRKKNFKANEECHLFRKHKIFLIQWQRFLYLQRNDTLKDNGVSKSVF